MEHFGSEKRRIKNVRKGICEKICRKAELTIFAKLRSNFLYDSTQMEKYIHIHSRKERSVFSLLLFLIPIIIFVGFVVFINLQTDRSKQKAAISEIESVVLGENTETIK